MVPSIQVLLSAWLAALAPAQAKQISEGSRSAAGEMSLETGDACAGLDREACCGQMLELAGFKAQGDHLPRLVRNAAHLTCQAEQKRITRQVCRSIAIARGFGAKRTEQICRPARRACAKDGTCRRCMSDLSELAYRGSHHVCRALTYVDKTSRGRTRIIRSTIPGGERRLEVRRSGDR